MATSELNGARKKNERLNRSEFMRGILKLESGPVTLDIGLTLKCNLKCVMCFTLMEPKFDLKDAVLQNLKPFLPFAYRIRWNDAGELFSSPRCGEYMKLINSIRAPYSYVSTNLFGVEKHIPDLMKGGITNMSVSLDACSKEIYESIRVGSRWEKVLANLKKINGMKEEKKTPFPYIRLVFVVMKRNIQEMPDFVRFAKEHGAQSVDFLRLLATPTQLEETESPAMEEEQEGLKEAVNVGRELDVSVRHTFFDEQYVSASEMDTEQFRTNKMVELEQTDSSLPFCSLPWREMLIEATGKVRVCCFSSEIVGDLNNQSVEEVWNGERMIAFRRKILFQDLCQCKKCPVVENRWKAENIVATRTRPSLESSLLSLDKMAGLNADCCPMEVKPIKITDLKSELVNVAPRILRPLILHKDLTPPKREHGKAYIGEYAKYILKRLVKTAVGFHSAWSFLIRLGYLLDVVINRISDILNRLNLSIKRQADFNSASKRVHQQLLAEVEILKETNQGLIEIMAGVLQENDPEGRVFTAPPTDMEDIFYNVHFKGSEMPEIIKAGETYQIPLTLSNNSLSSWESNGDYPVLLSYHILDENGLMLKRDGLRSTFDKTVKPLETRTVTAGFLPPDKSGRYIIRWNLVREGKAWFSERGGGVLDNKVEVT